LFLELRELAAATRRHPELAERWWSGYVGDWDFEQEEGTLVEAPSWLWI